jgi:hypothetical protein
VRVAVTGTNAAGSTTAVSAPTAVVQRPKLYPTEGPWINNGANQTFVGKPLSASDGTWFGADPISLSIEWQRCVEHDFPGYYAAARGCVDIPGATASGYTPTEADRGLFLRKVVTATNADGSWRIESNGVGPVTTFGGPIYIANRPTYEAGACAAVGCSSTVVPNPNGNWYSSDWTPLAPLAIQWARCTGELWTTCTDIAGATDATYTVQRADVGSYLRARVTATNDVGSTSIYTDAPLGPVTG